jgi:hypothetical protein
MEIRTSDEVVRRVIAKIDKRSLVGQEKYGATMMEEIKGQVKDLNRFLVDVQEELMDALLYIESARETLNTEIEECYIRDMEIIQYEDEGEEQSPEVTFMYPGDIKVTVDENKKK